jgi:hypothetical protein
MLLTLTRITCDSMPSCLTALTRQAVAALAALLPPEGGAERFGAMLVQVR